MIPQDMLYFWGQFFGTPGNFSYFVITFDWNHVGGHIRNIGYLHDSPGHAIFFGSVFLGHPVISVIL